MVDCDVVVRLQVGGGVCGGVVRVSGWLGCKGVRVRGLVAGGVFGFGHDGVQIR